METSYRNEGTDMAATGMNRKQTLDAARDRFMGDWDADGTTSVHLPRDIAESFLAQHGWSYIGRGCWTTPDEGRYIATDDAVQLQITAMTIGGQA